MTNLGIDNIIKNTFLKFSIPEHIVFFCHPSNTGHRRKLKFIYNKVFFVRIEITKICHFYGTSIRLV